MSARTSIPGCLSLVQHEKFGETAVAARAIKAGDVVVSERPLLLFRRRDPVIVLAAFCAAPQSAQETVLRSLHIPKPQDIEGTTMLRMCRDGAEEGCKHHSLGVRIGEGAAAVDKALKMLLALKANCWSFGDEGCVLYHIGEG